MNFRHKNGGWDDTRPPPRIREMWRAFWWFCLIASGINCTTGAGAVQGDPWVPTRIPPPPPQGRHRGRVRRVCRAWGRGGDIVGQ